MNPTDTNQRPTADWVTSLVLDFMRPPGANDLNMTEAEPAFAEPLVGFAAGDDPLFKDYKEHVGPFHWTPEEAFAMAFPDDPAPADELTVISWILPQTPATKADNRKMDFYPAERWARARIFGEKVNEKLRRQVVDALSRAGCKACAPVLLEEWKIEMSPRFGFASRWSERHMAHAAGLGTFGLCDALITPLGKAMRTGSLIARMKVPPTPRPYKGHRDYCLFFSQGICGKCMKRCPVGAITEAGKDKNKCVAHLHPTTEDHVKQTYGFDGYGCGLCQTGVPCESGIPLTDRT